ncbi:phosphate acyltransferase PlsX [bacterium]|nr:phosphate acyltransferase PlsX [Planctomycetota bacterium]MDB4426479.1 phosphate acyltransferase PlsX [bacterium]MDB4538638.1 phosphate acyltransferase PlsX [bacterium]MDB4724721.1 phosphate acyltransferase PlsX [Planctomycetota bacterium]MDB4736395.1 phosphate acyltransferase PlsX [Planctomycetota bacterium]
MDHSDRIALDVMGGDSAPACNLDGAMLAVERGVPAARLLLVGREDEILSGLKERGGNPGFEVLHADEVIAMDEKPAVALRAKPGSSIGVATGAVKAGLAGAHVSMGNTGAVVGAATVGLKTLDGVRRPGIAVTVRLTGKPVTILDMGANVVPKAEHLVQYGHMGAVLMRDVVKSERARVALLNIGEESTKGTDLLREAHAALAESDLDFIGNIESNEIFGDSAEVVVTDGFTGNVALKLMEGFSGFLLGLMGREMAAHGADWAPEVLGTVRKKVDYSEYGGALLLGVRGIVVIGHGRSDAHAVSNAIELAGRALDADVNGKIVQGLADRAPSS